MWNMRLLQALISEDVRLQLILWWNEKSLSISMV